MRKVTQPSMTDSQEMMKRYEATIKYGLQFMSLLYVAQRHFM